MAVTIWLSCHDDLEYQGSSSAIQHVCETIRFFRALRGPGVQIVLTFRREGGKFDD